MEEEVGILGYQREDGQLGIRNHVGVFFLVGCAEAVARRIVDRVPGTTLLGCRACESSSETNNKLIGLGKHPNVGGVLLAGLGCEETNAAELAHEIALAKKPVEILGIQKTGGTMKAIEQGVTLVEKLAREVAQSERAPLAPSDLIVGVECGGSDALSGLTANPAVGIAADLLIAAGGTVIFGEVGELLGCENILAERAVNPEVAQQVVEAIQRARRWCRMRGIFKICSGNQRGGLTTIEEKSLGAVAKAGHAPIQGVLDGSYCERPPRKGLYLLNNVFYTDQALYGAGGGFDSTDLTSLAASGAHLVVFTTGRGSPVGSSVLPVLKVASNSQIFHYMADNMDVNAGAIIDCTRTHDQVGQEIYEEILAVCAGKQTKAEILGHGEFHIPSRFPMPMDNIEREFFCRM